MNHREFFNRMAPQWDEQVRHDACKLSRIVTALSCSRESACWILAQAAGVMLPYLRQALACWGS